MLRPLRSVTRVAGMRRLVVALLKSLPLLLDVVMLFAFLLFIYGIAGVQVFGGALRKRCATMSLDPSVGSSYGPWSAIPSSAVVFAPDTSDLYPHCTGPRSDAASYYLGSDGATVLFNATGKIDDNGVVCPDSMPICYVDSISEYYGMSESAAPPRPAASSAKPEAFFLLPFLSTPPVNFDNILFAILYVFIVITQDGWSQIMYELQDAVSPYIWPYFVSLILFGSWFVVNLALAVLYTHFAGTKTSNGGGSGSSAQGPNSTMASMDAEALAKRSQSVAALRARLLEQGAEADEVDAKLSKVGSQKELKEMSRMNVDMLATRSMSQRDHSDYRKGLTLGRRIRLDCYWLLNQKWLAYTMNIMILSNTVIMGAQHANQPRTLDEATAIINYVVTGAFIFEMVVKHVAFGLRGYWSDGYDAFDGFVTLASIADILVNALVSGTSGSALGALRSLRLFRILRLARQLKELQKVLDTIFRAVAGLGYMSLLLLLFLIIFALLGMQLFGYMLHFCTDTVDGSFSVCPPGETDCPPYPWCYVSCTADQYGTWLSVSGSDFLGMAYCERFPRDPSLLPPGQSYTYLANVGEGYIPRFNYDNFFWSFVTVFYLLVQDNWSSSMYDCMRSSVGYASVIYFLFVMVIGLYIMLNLFLAILLDGFDRSSEEEDGKPKEGRLASLRRNMTAMGSNLRSQASRLFARGKSQRSAELAASAVESGGVPKASGSTNDLPKLLGLRHEGSSKLTFESQNSVGSQPRPQSVAFSEAQVSGTGGPSFVSKSALSKGAQDGGAVKAAEKSGADAEDEAPWNRGPQKLKGVSLFLFPPENRIRRFLASIVLSQYFDLVIMFVIIASSVALSLGYPRLGPGSGLKNALRVRTCWPSCATACLARRPLSNIPPLVPCRFWMSSLWCCSR